MLFWMSYKKLTGDQAIEPTSLRLKERLQPILTVHGYGELEGSVSALVIISQVVG